MSRTLLVLGANGQVARELAMIAGDHGFAPRLVGRDTADLTTAPAGALIDQYAPAAVINAAAYTAVDQAEQQEDAAFALNADMPGRFAAACAARDIPFVHISTDYVFDGTKAGPYVEDDPVAPQSAYGRSKAAGEALVAAAGGRTAIVRTAWVYSAHGANFLKTMLRLAATRDELGVVADQYGCPTWAQDVARACLLLSDKLIADAPAARGVFHAASSGKACWADFAEAIFARSAAVGGPSARVRRITTAEYPMPAARPANSQLSCERLVAATGWRPPEWRERIERCVDAVRALEVMT